jgi:Glycosyl hydrolase catalytic core
MEPMRNFRPSALFGTSMLRLVRPGTLILAAVGAVVLTAAPATAREVGIGDQRAAMFSNRHFRTLHVHISRLIVSYDAVLRHTPEAGEIDAWIRAAEQSHIRPLIAFQHVRGCYVGRHGHIPHLAKCHLPSVAEFRRAFTAFRRTYPEIRDYSPWNEANHRSQPTFNNPRRAASYYNVVRAECRGCTIVAADVLDAPHFTGWLKKFRRAARGNPRIWGLHNYEDTNNHTTIHTRQMLATVRGQVWFTETGGIVHFPHRPFNPRRAASATKFMFRLARMSRRITRVYIYQWTGARRSARFDAGLVDPHGHPRPAYWVVKAHLAPKGR